MEKYTIIYEDNYVRVVHLCWSKWIVSNTEAFRTRPLQKFVKFPQIIRNKITCFSVRVHQRLFRLNKSNLRIIRYSNIRNIGTVKRVPPIFFHSIIIHVGLAIMAIPRVKNICQPVGKTRL